MGRKRNDRRGRAVGPRSTRPQQRAQPLQAPNNSKRPMTTPTIVPPSASSSDGQHAKRNMLIWAVSAAGAVGIALSIIAYIFDDIATYAKVMSVLLTFAVTAIFAPGWRRRRLWRALGHAASILVLTAIWLGFYFSSQPTDVDRQIYALLEDTEKANIWVGRDPAVFREPSLSYIKNNFSAFDPAKSHAWEELPVDKAPALTDLVVQSGQYAGHGVVTLGRVGAAQPIGGDQWVVQVTPITQEAAQSSETREQVAANVGVEYASTLLGDTIEDPNRVSYMLYVRIVLPPFAALPIDETVLVKGTPIAYGRTQDRTGRQMDVAYLVGSNIRRFYDSPFLAPQPASQAPTLETLDLPHDQD